MMKLSTYLLLFFFISIISCRKDSSNGCGGSIKTYHQLSDFDKAKIPYKVNDTLVFISKSNDTAICIGQGKKQNFGVQSTPKVNGDCDPDFDYYEFYDYNFKSNNLKFNIALSIYKNDGYGFETVHFNFNETDLPLYCTDIGNPEYSTYIDSIIVLGKWYRSVSYAAKYFNPKLDKLYYNKEFGILKIQNSDSSEVWELLNKK
ncbi:MAG: hypothetical protein NTU43_07440 [Bacteroidetes bacterium]|nr:hypothetical protein [Bacteroidota bacterium]